MKYTSFPLESEILIFYNRCIERKNVSITGEDNGPLTVTFNKTGNAYTITIEGEISETQLGNSGGEGGNSDAIISLLEQYLFGDNPNGKEYITYLSEDILNYKENKDLGIVEGDIKGLNLALLGNEYIFYIEYEGAKYKFKT